MSTALTHDVDDISGGRYVPRWKSATTVSAVSSALILATIAAVGGWMRRWISDDGLIVLRTVRNLLAGNGPVFNAGERVETNTSTLWQYLIYVVGLVSDARLALAMEEAWNDYATRCVEIRAGQPTSRWRHLGDATARLFSPLL